MTESDKSRGNAETDLVISKFYCELIVLDLSPFVVGHSLIFLYGFLKMWNDMYREIFWLMPDTTLTWREKFVILVWIWRNVEFRFSGWTDTGSRLLRKATDVYADFLKRTNVAYLGIINICHTNSAGVKYPVDFFIKHFYDAFYPLVSLEAFDKYKRVNPTLDLKLEHLEEFAELHDFKATNGELDEAMHAVYRSMCLEPGYEDYLRTLRETVRDGDMYGLNVDLTSAAGYPYAQGVKRRDVYADAVNKAHQMVHDDMDFLHYMHDHVWYTTGRARMRKREDEDAGRLIMYSGFSSMLIAMLYVQPTAMFMNRCLDWCAVGMSWMHGGARDFAKWFECSRGFAPQGYRYVSVDIKGWDSHLHPKLFEALKKLYGKIFDDAELTSNEKHRFYVIFNDMVEAKVLFPMGRLFQVFQGMKSGWANTANDNTLIHQMIFEGMQGRMRVSIKHKLYGDDNFMLVPDEITDEMLIDEYGRYGCKVGRIHSSRYIGDVDFLSKYVVYKDGEYFIFRPAVETHARILMPEEMNPEWRPRPDADIAAERALGHLLDNPFCESVRTVCYDLLKRLKDQYGVESVVITPEMRKRYPWRELDTPSVLPVVPKIKFIEELYGVSPAPLARGWPEFPKLVKFGYDKLDALSIKFDSAYGYARDVMRNASRVSKGRLKNLVAQVSPYQVPKKVYGTHAARAEFAVRYFGLDTTAVLDFGSHPGACAASFIKRSRNVTCVSLKPSVDSHRPFCPYVFRSEYVRLIEMDADDYRPDRHFTMIHDDVDVVGSRARSVDIFLAKGAIKRAIKHVKSTDSYVMTIRDVTPEITELLYECYKAYGYFDIVKPHYSHPWRCEFMVCFRRSNLPPVRKLTFKHALNAFLNAHSTVMISWNEKLGSAIENLIIGRGYETCPWQDDMVVQSAIVDDYMF